MSMTSAFATLRKGLLRVRRGSSRAGREAREEVHIVPRDSISASALAAVVAIMTFLAAVTSGGVAMVITSANDWQSEVSREMTIQIRPTPNVEADIAKAMQLAKAAPGVSVRRFAFLAAGAYSARTEGASMAPGRARHVRKERQWRH